MYAPRHSLTSIASTVVAAYLTSQIYVLSATCLKTDCPGCHVDIHERQVWPLVSATKLVSQTYMIYPTDRWSQTKAPQAATAWFNGVGLNSWENVWGIWNGLTPRDAAIYRRMGALLRFAGGHVQGSGQDDATSTRSLLRSTDWTPFAPTSESSNQPPLSQFALQRWRR